MFSLLILMAGCSSLSAPIASYNPETQARIRVYKGPNTMLSPDSACSVITTQTPLATPDEIAHVAPGDKGAFAASGTGYVPNHTIGMPVPENAYDKSDPSVFNAFIKQFGWVPFNEYVIPANEKLTIDSSFVQTQGGEQVGSQSGGFYMPGYSMILCKPNVGTFTPEAGKDYETYLDLHNCQLYLTKIVSQKGEFIAVPMSFSRSSRCFGEGKR